ncbi:MAG: DUF421 domain-containing protein [Bacilli bacterium]
MEIFTIIIKTLFFYIMVAVIFRLMGKREVGQLGTFDLVVFILIAELVAMGIEHNTNLIIHTLPIIILVVLQIIISKVSIKSSKFRRMIDGKPTMIIKKGIINFKNMVEQRYSLDDLLLQLREKDARSIEEVEYALLETNGKLSVFRYDDKKNQGIYPLPLILDGEIQYDNLYNITRNKKWIMDILTEKEIMLEDVFYAFNKKNELYIIKKSDVKK